MKLTYQADLPDVSIKMLLEAPLERLIERAGAMTLQEFGPVVTYSRKVFIPLTRLCRDVCHYCTFATAPRHIGEPYLSRDAVLAIARSGAAAGCREALFTLGDRPEARYRVARAALTGIGETRVERIEALLAIRDAHAAHGHIQEVIVQNFRAKPGTRMARHPEPSLDEHLWTISAARLLLGPSMTIQAPPNLQPDGLAALLAAGVNDWGGVSPVTIDHVNPEAPWPHLAALEAATAATGRVLQERLAIAPSYALDADRWADRPMAVAVRRAIDARGLPFVEGWRRGEARSGPSFREAILMHAIARLSLHPVIANIQASWVKLGDGVVEALRAGANDLGGTLMDESITRAAGGCNGQNMDVGRLATLAAAAGRPLVRRSTLYAGLPAPLLEAAE